MKKLVIILLCLIIPSFLFAKSVRVRGKVTKSGTYRQSYYRTSPNKSKFDNYSTKGNINPYTGKKGTKKIFK